MYMAMCILGHNNDAAKHVSEQTVCCVKASNTACKLLMAYSQLQLLLSKNPVIKLLKQHCFGKICVCIHESIHLLNIIDLAIDIPSEEASVSYPECIL